MNRSFKPCYSVRLKQFTLRTTGDIERYLEPIHRPLLFHRWTYVPVRLHIPFVNISVGTDSQLGTSHQPHCPASLSCKPLRSSYVLELDEIRNSGMRSVKAGRYCRLADNSLPSMMSTTSSRSRVRDTTHRKLRGAIPSMHRRAAFR